MWHGDRGSGCGSQLGESGAGPEDHKVISRLEAGIAFGNQPVFLASGVSPHNQQHREPEGLPETRCRQLADGERWRERNFLDGVVRRQLDESGLCALARSLETCQCFGENPRT